MSGGFFRGTTADQDTRFSNKQAKLLKSQKFAPELEHLIDVSKVKMDVIKPWIATKVTELLGGFEDEVLINFIYGLLEGKEINGKSIQIQLTGFMEKSTGKFMKELWSLLLSAQKNASGVPQQFLDAKEEETKKKKAETDRIFNEIQRRKEKESEQGKERKLDGGCDNNSAEESKRRRDRGFDTQSSGDENGADLRNGIRERKRSPKSPYSSDRSASLHRGRSLSRSVSPRPRMHSISPDRVQRTSRRSVSPRRRATRESVSPRRRSNYKRRSSSRTHYRSPSPMRWRIRSPVYRSPPPARRRSPSPFRRRSPPRRHRSPSPWRRRSPSPWRRRSPSPLRQRRQRSSSSPRSRSPIQRRSPIRRPYRSPSRRRSPYPIHRRSPSLDRRGSPLPRRRRSQSLVRRRSPLPARRSVRVHRSPSRSLSHDSRSSASPARRRSASPVKKQSPRSRRSLHGSPRERTRLNDHSEPAMMARRQSMAMSPQRDHSDTNRSRRKVPSVSPSPAKSPSYSPQNRTKTTNENRRLASPYKSPMRAGDRMSPEDSQSPLGETKVRRAHHGSPGTNEDELRNARVDEQNKYKSAERTDRLFGGKNGESRDKPSSQSRDTIVSRLNDTEMPSSESPQKELHAGEGPDEKRNSHSKDARVNSRSDALVESLKKRRSPSVSSDPGSEGIAESDIDDRKEAKRRKKEEKKLRKEERRQRREERRRRREEKRASKRKRKSMNADALSSDVGKHENIGNASNGERRMGRYSSEEETESQKKRLEIELREKALESLRAKKGNSR